MDGSSHSDSNSIVNQKKMLERFATEPVLHNKGMDGKHLTSNAIYGYKKDPDDPDLWIIDEEAAAVVRHIYQLIMNGNGPMQVARILKDKNSVHNSPEDWIVFENRIYV